MSGPRKRPALGVIIYSAFAFLAATYFTFAAVQGDYGVFRRIQVEAEAKKLRAEHERLSLKLAEMRNKTRRLSDDYLDLDLLDERARKVLGLIRPDEIVIR
ncbi:MAG: septum formation initiator family protein [Paracoccaceae bacterium]